MAPPEVLRELWLASGANRGTCESEAPRFDRYGCTSRRRSHGRCDAPGPRHGTQRASAYLNFALLVEGQVVGHAMLCPESDSAEVAVFVHQRYRGLGLGRKLLGVLLNEARQHSLRRIWGITDLYNIAIVRSVHSFGFSFGQDAGEFWLELESANNLSAVVARAA